MDAYVPYMYKFVNGGNGSFEVKKCMIIMHFISGKKFLLLRETVSFMLKTEKHHLNNAKVGKLKRKPKRTNPNKTSTQSKNKATQSETQGHDEKTRRKKRRGNFVSAQLMNPGFHGFDPYAGA